MNNIINIVERYKNKIFDGKIYFYPDIPQKKLKNVFKTYADIGNETPLVLIDDTVFGSAKAGLILTNKAIYIKDSNSKSSFSCLLNNIEQVTFKSYVILNKLTINDTLTIDFTQPDKKSLSLFSEMLQEINGLKEKDSTSWSNIGIGVGIGALFGGPIGAAIGAAVGASLENKGSEKIIADNHEDKTELIFIVTLAAMMAKMAKADGVITESEANQISELLDELEFTDENRDFAIKAFNDAKDNDYSIYDYAQQYKDVADYELQEFLYSTLWTIALADGVIHENEKDILKSILQHLDLPESKFHEYWYNIHHEENTQNKTIKEDYTFTLEECYITLGCNSSDNMQTIKKRYRELISEYHPDKIQSKGLPNSFIKFATEQMQKINFAYETIQSHKK